MPVENGTNPSTVFLQAGRKVFLPVQDADGLEWEYPRSPIYIPTMCVLQAAPAALKIPAKTIQNSVDRGLQ